MTRWMIDFLVVLMIVAIGAWLVNMFHVLQRQIRVQYRKGKVVRDKIWRVEGVLIRLRKEEQALQKEIDGINKEMLALHSRMPEVRQRLSLEQARHRAMLLILSERRNAGDHEWIVSISNTRIASADVTSPLSVAWNQGRDYLIWAENERAAVERIERRFPAMLGYQVRSIIQIKDEQYATTGVNGMNLPFNGRTEKSAPDKNSSG